MMRLCLLLTFVTCHLTLGRGLHAATPLVLSNQHTEYALAPHFDILLDPDGQFTVEAVLAPELASRFSPNNKDQIRTSRPMWLRLSIRNESSWENWTIKIPVQSWKSEMYLTHNGIDWTKKTTGGSIPWNVREVKYRYPAYSLRLVKGETATLYVRIIPEVVAPNSAPIDMWRADTFKQHARSDYMLHGLYFGTAGVMVLYNLFLFVSLRDRSYLFYGLAMTAMAFMFAQLAGFNREFLWPEESWSHSRIITPITCTAWITAIVFYQDFLLTTSHAPRLRRALWWVAGYYSLLGLARVSQLTFADIVQTVDPLVSICAWGLALSATVQAIRRGYRPAKFFLFGFGWLVVAGVLTSLGFLGVLPRISRETQEQSQRKSAFLASMAHELRTPLNAIKGFNNLVLRRAGDTLPEQQRDNLTKVDRASDHLLHTINDLLDLSKIEAGRMDVNVTTFDIRQTILSACEVVSPLVQEGVELRHGIPDDIGQATTDQQRLSQMLINLLSNAIKFTETGFVTVKVSVAPSAFPGAPRALSISVTDTGRGIPEHELPTLRRIPPGRRPVRQCGAEWNGIGSVHHETLR